MSAHASHQGSHQFETFRPATRNERPSGYEQTNGWGRVSSMQREGGHSQESQHGHLHKVNALWIEPNPATKQPRHTTPHKTTPHHPDTTPRIAGSQRRGKGRGLPQRLLLAQLVSAATTTPRQPLSYCVGAPLLSSPVQAGTRVAFWPGSWLWLQAMGWSSIRSQPSGRRQPSPTMHVLVRDCAHPLCEHACTCPPYLH